MQAVKEAELRAEQAEDAKKKVRGQDSQDRNDDERDDDHHRP